MTFSCKSAMAEAQSEYISLPVETRAGKTVNLRNLLILDKDSMVRVSEALEAFGAKRGDDVRLTEMMPTLYDMLATVADNKAAMQKEMADWPLAMYLSCINAWMEATELGEAPDSGN